MNIKRKIDSELSAWKKEKERKPLLIRGARQVGKSFSVRNLGKSFEHYLELNFEKDERLISVFERGNDVKQLCSTLALMYNTPVIAGKTLLFLDEIQLSPHAIKMLRYFYEDYPELHVIGAGSLLEFALGELPSFGVGRIRSMFMYPLSFDEFLGAIGENMLQKARQELSLENPFSDEIHQKANELLKIFLLIGGMPEVVAHFAKSKDLIGCEAILRDLLVAYQDDFRKYAKQIPLLQMLEVFQAVGKQMGGKFNYSRAVAGGTHRQAKEALQLLIMAGLAIPVKHTSANGLPLGAESNDNRIKLLLLDTGLFQQLNSLDLSEFLLADDFQAINKGFIAEQFVGLELLKSSNCYFPASLYFWQREKAGSSAEVDYIIQHQGKVLPIEVKSGTQGKMQSLRLFLNEKKLSSGIRTSLENFSTYNDITVYPMYAIALLNK